MAKPVIINSDGGLESCDALWWALTSPDLDVVAVTVESGVVPVARGAQNLANVIASAGASVPIALGSDDKLGRAPEIPPASLTLGEDGMGNSGIPDVAYTPERQPAHELIAELLAGAPGTVTLLALGPFANVARALRAEPEASLGVADLVVMGGTVAPPGNALPWGEFNIVYDPTAAQEMVAAPWPQPPLMVGLHVTHQATMGEAEFDALERGTSPAAEFMRGPMRHLRATAAAQTDDGTCPSHDTFVTMVAADPSLVDSELLPVAVDNAGGAAWGSTVVDLRARILSKLAPDLAEMAYGLFFDGKAAWRVAMTADVERFRARVQDFYWGR